MYAQKGREQIRTKVAPSCHTTKRYDLRSKVVSGCIGLDPSSIDESVRNPRYSVRLDAPPKLG